MTIAASMPSSWPVVPDSWGEGTWPSPGYRSSGTRSKWARAFLAMMAVLTGMGALILLDGITVVSHAIAGTLDDLEGQKWLDAVNGISSLEIIGSLATAIAVLAWLSRAVENEPALGGGRQKESPRGAIGWWFCPIANFWMPYRVVRNLWDRLALDRADRGHELLIAWWLAFIIGVTIERGTYLIALGATTYEELKGMLLIGSVAEITMLASAIMGFLVVREIEMRARTRALALGIAGDNARWPAVMTAPSAPPEPAFGAPAPVAAELDAPVQSAIAFCPKCGTARITGTRFCAKCGADLEGLAVG